MQAGTSPGKSCHLRMEWYTPPLQQKLLLQSMCFAFLSKPTVHLSWGCHLNKWKCLSIMCFHCSWGLFTNSWLPRGNSSWSSPKSCELETILLPRNAGGGCLQFYRCFTYGYILSTLSDCAGINPAFSWLFCLSLSFCHHFFLCLVLSKQLFPLKKGHGPQPA